jgi:hypothetical protein
VVAFVDNLITEGCGTSWIETSIVLPPPPPFSVALLKRPHITCSIIHLYKYRPAFTDTNITDTWTTHWICPRDYWARTSLRQFRFVRVLCGWLHLDGRQEHSVSCIDVAEPVMQNVLVIEDRQSMQFGEMWRRFNDANNFAIVAGFRTCTFCAPLGVWKVRSTRDVWTSLTTCSKPRRHWWNWMRNNVFAIGGERQIAGICDSGVRATRPEPGERRFPSTIGNLHLDTWETGKVRSLNSTGFGLRQPGAKGGQQVLHCL